MLPVTLAAYSIVSLAFLDEVALGTVPGMAIGGYIAYRLLRRNLVRAIDLNVDAPPTNRK